MTPYGVGGDHFIKQSEDEGFSESTRPKGSPRCAHFFVKFHGNRTTIPREICLELNALIISERDHLKAIWVYNASLYKNTGVNNVLVDSHCHLDKLDYDDLHNDVAEVIEKAKDRGVDYLLSVGVTLRSFPTMMDLIRPYPNVFASCGVHPLDIEEGFDFDQLRTLAADDRVVAIGETGLDYHYQPELAEKQQDVFRQHVRIAVELNKPLIIHTRMAREDTLRILREENAQKVGGVLHCFTESFEMAEAAIELGFYISISGIVTFNKASELKDVVRRLPLEKLLVETDSPYLAPIPYRGKQNQPAYVREVAEYVGLLKGVSAEEVAATTTENFFKLFSTATR